MSREADLDRMTRIRLLLSILDRDLEYSSPRRTALLNELETLELGFEDQVERETDSDSEADGEEAHTRD